MRPPYFFILALTLCTAVPGAPTKPDKTPPPVVTAEALKKESLFDLLSYPARLVPKTTASLLSESEGIVEKINVSLGKAVKRGERILTIANTDPVYHYAPVSVRAPVAGVISAIDVTEGSRVTKGFKLGAITDPSEIKIQIEVAAADLQAINVGLEGELKLPAGDNGVPVRVLGISPLVDSATGTASVELSPHQKAGAIALLPPGLVGRVTFKAREHKGIQVPEGAVVYRGQAPNLRVIEGGKAKYVPVTLGPTRRGQVEILKGVSADTQIVTRASTYIADGEAVNVQDGTAKN